MADAAPAPRALIAGNWKMHGLGASLNDALQVRDALTAGEIDVMICPPATLLARFADIVQGSSLRVGAQDCHFKPSGAHTGDISSEMIAEAGGTAVIVGHSERRADHGETDALVRAKAEAAHRAGLLAIICIGETEGARRSELTLDIVSRQLAGSLPDGANAANTVIAYEPVWAIGTGLTPTAADVVEVHGFIREALVRRFGADGSRMRLLYGGSVKPENARELLGIPNVNGALVGGASLKAADFLGIIDACRKIGAGA